MTKGEKIRLLLDQSGMSRTDFAEKIGASKQTVYKYENDIVTNIPSDTIERMSKALGVSPAYLMGWEDPIMQAAIKGAEVQKNAYVNLPVSKEEYELVDAYRKMNRTQQDMIRRSCGLSPVGESAESSISRSPEDIDQGLDSA